MARTEFSSVTAYNYAYNRYVEGERNYTDFVSGGRRRGGGGAPPFNYRAELCRNDFAHPSSIAVTPETRLDYDSLVFIESYGWFMVEEIICDDDSRTPRFDMWTAGSTDEELQSLAGYFEVTTFAPDEIVPTVWRNRTATSAWTWQRWLADPRLNEFRPRETWYGLYVEGSLVF